MWVYFEKESFSNDVLEVYLIKIIKLMDEKW